MANLWQHAVVGAAVLAALAWLVRRRVRKKKSCSDCALADAVQKSGGPPGPAARGS